MQLKNYLKISSLLLVLTSCSAIKTPEPEIIVKTEIVKPSVVIPARPGKISMLDVNFRVVNKDNLEAFLADHSNPELVFIAISVKDYEKLSLNVAELKRYIEQQKEIIIYFEDSLK